MRKRITVLVAALMMALTMSLSGLAFGKITEERRNPAGNETQGQGQAITVTNVNPSGKAPPGQN
jgi:F0F1-type ATP synthase membrane subunit c/vacuolar-type H+-ATPase subunit K